MELGGDTREGIDRTLRKLKAKIAGSGTLLPWTGSTLVGVLIPGVGKEKIWIGHINPAAIGVCAKPTFSNWL